MTFSTDSPLLRFNGRFHASSEKMLPHCEHLKDRSVLIVPPQWVCIDQAHGQRSYGLFGILADCKHTVNAFLKSRSPDGNMPTEQNLKLWELAGKEEGRVFSPYAWRVRLVLAHKGVKYETVPWRYSQKELIKPSDKVIR